MCNDENTAVGLHKFSTEKPKAKQFVQLCTSRYFTIMCNIQALYFLQHHMIGLCIFPDVEFVRGFVEISMKVSS